MKHWDSLLELSIKKKDLIDKVLGPLTNYFDIGAIGYFKITRKGNFSYLTNRPDVMRDYVSKGLIAKDPFYRHPNFYQNQLIVFNQSISQDSFDPEISEYLREDAGYKGGFYHLEITSEGLEGYEFGFHMDSVRVHHFLQDRKLMDAYFLFFKKETKDLRSLIERESVSLIHEIGNAFFTPPEVIRNLEENQKKGFLKAIGQWQDEFVEIHLSPRELDLIELYLQRKTAAETGKILHLSTRTVENYFETIKEKMCCKHKSEIYEKIKVIVSQGYYNARLSRYF